MPNREFCDGEKEMVSIRLPVKLVKVLKRIAKDSGWNFADIVTTALDQYAQHSEKEGK